VDTISGFWAGALAISARVDVHDLAAHAGGWEALMACTVDDFVALGVDEKRARRWRDTPPLQTQFRALTALHPHYPAALHRGPSSPPVLFVQGALDALSGPGVAVVGTRRCTPYGASVARHLGAALAGAGFTVVSGLARGIDSHAHRGGIRRTVAVMGHGLATTSPASSAPLRAKILDHGGAIVSAFPDALPPAQWTFPRRNSWIVLLSERVVVIQAPDRSGALITAHLANQLGRDVHAVPGALGVWASRGSNRLLRDGVHPLLDVDEFVSDLSGTVPAGDATERWRALLWSGAPLAEVAQERGCSILEMLDEVTRMELAGEVVLLPGARYAPTRSEH